MSFIRAIWLIERGYHYDDPSLIRHVYDLNAKVDPIEKWISLSEVAEYLGVSETIKP
jgi:hypothetical protein